MVIPDPGALYGPSTHDRSVEERFKPLAESIVGSQTTDVQEDPVSLTPKSHDFGKAVRQAQSMPDIREDRVSQLRRQIAEGRYQVRGDRAAANLMHETMQNNDLLRRIEPFG